MTARSMAEEVTTLFSLPGVALKLNQMLDHPRITDGAIGEVVIHDPALTARLLQLANCDGREPRVDMVSEAIGRLGRSAVRDLVLTASVTDTFRGIPPQLVDMERFWFNSVVCGVIARALALRCRIFESEPLFVAGLLHKVGRLAFYTCRPRQYRRVLETGDTSEDAINRAEREIFGFDHAELGAELLRSWALPKRLRIAIAHYPAPHRAPEFRRGAALIHVASALACIIEPGLSLDEALNAECFGFDLGAWRMLGLSLDAIPAILDQGLLQTFEIFELIRPDP